ncbi:MAG: hypothetical protein ABI355_00375 [Solirubrobacteraceae bacterium]
MTEPHDLYGLPLERFVTERAALTKALRTAGSRERATEVASLRKPSVAAWAVNQLVRAHRREVAALFAAGDGLEHAQAKLLTGGGDAQALRAAVERERGTVDELTGLARGLLSSDGHQLTQTTLARVSESLHAAALDPDARAQVRDGCLARELRHIGLGDGRAASSGASDEGGRSAGRRGQRQRAERQRAERLEAERAEQLRVARTAETEARRIAERAKRKLHTAQARRDGAAQALQKAEDALAAAREDSERATLEHRRADQALARV